MQIQNCICVAVAVAVAVVQDCLVIRGIPLDGGRNKKNILQRNLKMGHKEIQRSGASQILLVW